MNYQKLFSRLYSSAEQANGELLQKYSILTGNVTTCNSITQEEVSTSSIVVEEQVDSSDLMEYQPEIEHVEDEVMLITTNISNEPLQSWNESAIEEIVTIVEPLMPDEVRWFYKLKDDKSWTEFNGYDSLLIEEKYRTMPPIPDDEIQSPIIPAEVFDNSVKIPEEDGQVKTNGTPSKSMKRYDGAVGASPRKADDMRHNEFTDTIDFSSPSKHYHAKSNSEESSEDSFEDDPSINADRIVVRGGLYEVDVAKMICESIYWPGEKYTITRGLYFYDGSWQPLERCHGEVLEAEHLRLFGQKTCETDRLNITAGVAVHSHYFSQFHVEWMSCCEIYLYWGGAPRQLVRSVTQKLGFYQSTGYRLRRGYKTKASISERPPDITHVVFVIHGIGQKMDEGRIIRNTNSLRGICEWLRVHHPRGAPGSRAELFPARWRAGARGRAAGLLAAAAPPGAPALRRAINEAAMDVMYYTSPLYGRQVQDDLRRELNRLYTMFMARNPQFNGLFSAVAHSLGSVILYDIIIDYQLGCEHCAGTRNQPKQKLLFPLQQLFCLGSPLSVFLAMRHPNPSLCAVLPQVFTPRLFNVFHLSDPVAYRLEPLISRNHSDQSPVVIPPYHVSPMSNLGLSSPARGPWRLWSYVKHPWQRTSEELTTKESSLNESPSKLKDAKTVNIDDITTIICKDDEIILESDSVTTSCCIRRHSADSKKEVRKERHRDKSPRRTEKLCEPQKSGIAADKSPSRKDNEKALKSAEDDDLLYRLDYTLRDTGMANNYLSAITSHTSYWTNYDVAQFILSNLHPEMHSDEDV